jgi:hypothetical protein
MLEWLRAARSNQCWHRMTDLSLGLAVSHEMASGSTKPLVCFGW